MSSPEYFITLQNKRYSYRIEPRSKEFVRVVCEAANIDQEFLNKDIPALLIDLPNLILAEKEYREKNDQVVRFRVTVEDKKLIEKRAVEAGYSTVSEFLRRLALGNP